MPGVVATEECRGGIIYKVKGAVLVLLFCFEKCTTEGREGEKRVQISKQTNPEIISTLHS